MFNERTAEFYNGTNLPVTHLPKYNEGRKAALKLIEDKEYMTEGDFWILMNTNKAKDKMLYSGLIISHNGCLKINDNQAPDMKFKPECVTLDINGWGGSLVYTYNCPKQGIYEVGEVSPKNCKNDYPYAMAFKRCFDRVVLKLCKLAFDGIYSDSEADEFKNPNEDNFQEQMDNIAMATPEQKTELLKLAAKANKTIRKDVMERLTEIQAAEQIKTLKATLGDVA